MAITLAEAAGLVWARADLVKRLVASDAPDIVIRHATHLVLQGAVDLLRNVDHIYFVGPDECPEEGKDPAPAVDDEEYEYPPIYDRDGCLLKPKVPTPPAPPSWAG